MKVMTIEGFGSYIKAAGKSMFSVHYSNQPSDAMCRDIKLDLMFKDADVFPEIGVVKFSSENGCIFADNVKNITVKEGNPLGIIIEILCQSGCDKSGRTKMVVTAL